jgi:hypothetical protein
MILQNHKLCVPYFLIIKRLGIAHTKYAKKLRDILFKHLKFWPASIPDDEN